MKFLSNQQVSELLTTEDAIASMREAFAHAAEGAHQGRVRTSAANGVMLSMMGEIGRAHV